MSVPVPWVEVDPDVVIGVFVVLLVPDPSFVVPVVEDDVLPGLVVLLDELSSVPPEFEPSSPHPETVASNQAARHVTVFCEVVTSRACTFVLAHASVILGDVASAVPPHRPAAGVDMPAFDLAGLGLRSQLVLLPSR